MASEAFLEINGESILYANEIANPTENIVIKLLSEGRLSTKKIADIKLTGDVQTTGSL